MDRSSSAVVAIGERVRIQGFALAGVATCEAETADDARTAWRSLGPAVAIVILTPAAAQAIAGRVQDTAAPLTVVMPP